MSYPPRDFGFGEAIRLMRRGEYVARRGWNGPGQFLALQVPDANSKMSLPYIFIMTAEGLRVPWIASQTDALGDDWYVVEGTDEDEQVKEEGG